MEKYEKLTLSTATARFGVKDNVFAFKMRGLLTVGTMCQLQDSLGAQWRHYPVVMADITEATIAYLPSDRWFDYSLKMVFAVLVRQDQIKQMSVIAKNRSKAGCVRRLFTDAQECESWVLRELVLIQPDSARRYLLAA